MIEYKFLRLSQYWKLQLYKNASRDINHLTGNVDFAYLWKHFALLYYSSNPWFGTFFKTVFLPQPNKPQFWKIHLKKSIIRTYILNSVAHFEFLSKFSFLKIHCWYFYLCWNSLSTDKPTDHLTYRPTSKQIVIVGAALREEICKTKYSR